MKAVLGHGGTIVMPDASTDAMLQRVLRSSGEGPLIGSLPNCFEAKISENFGHKEGVAVAEAVSVEWQRIADTVWNKDRLESVGSDKIRWDEQIKNFWEIAWIISDPAAEQEESAVWTMRKNWRNHYPPEQAGDKCTMMGEWQEISWADKPGDKKQKDFWSALRTVVKSELELRDGERLCAIAYVKRRFIHVWKGLNSGWVLPANVPSTSYMAAVHWIEQILKCADPRDITAFQKAAKGITDYGEWRTSIRCIDEQRGTWGTGQQFASLDGRVFFRSALENSQEFDVTKADDVLSTLNNLSNTEIEPGRKVGQPSPFYAILLMDGDNLSKTKQAMDGGANKLSKALSEFTGKVHGIVQESNGFLVYAGGDDVLALLPLEDALSCALALQTAYMKVFEDKGLAAGSYSISAALIYAHMKLPLSLVLKDSHSLLDDVAKAETGRDAIAVRVWKPGGALISWSGKWGDGGINVTTLCNLAKAFQHNEETEPGHASKPLFRIRERLEMIEGAADFDETTVQQMLAAEYVTSGVLSEEEQKQRIAEKRVADLLSLCKKPDGGYGAESAMLLRFLAQKGVEQ